MAGQGEYTIALCKGGTTYTDTRRGIAPMLDLLEQGIDLSGFSVADRVVGKAAAMLFVLLRVKSLYAEVITGTAKAVLEAQGIECVYGTLVERLIDADGKVCPSELAVENVVDPSDAPAALK